MPIRLVQAATNQTLWQACAEAFLAEALPRRGPRDHRAWVWITHRILRDRLLAEAAARGCPGWLAPPISFFSELPALFGIHGRRIGLLTRRRLVGQIAAEHAPRSIGAVAGGDSVARGHMLDSLFGELLPEGVRPERLQAALATLGGDAFARKRSRWITRVYAHYLRALAQRGEYDERQVHALVAERIEQGALRAAIGGARCLHVYGITSVRHRERLLAALARQEEVEVRLYMVCDEEPAPRGGATELSLLAGAVRRLPGGTAAVPEVQPAPDAAREVEWVARCIKQLLVDGGGPAEQIAVVARSGRDDTRRVAEALARYGVPCSVRVRMPLQQVPALRALSNLFRAAARDWQYRPLRAVLTGGYFDTGIDTRWLDHVAERTRVRGLDAWREQLDRLRCELTEEEDGAGEERADEGAEAGREGGAYRFRGTGLFADRLAADAVAFARFCEAVAPLAESRSERDWIELTLGLLRGNAFRLRERLSQAVQERWEIVRADQRGLLQLERLLAEWQGLADAAEPLDVAAWHELLARLLEGQELALSTPEQRGVQVLEAHDAALVPFRHTFLIHANDGEFPRPRGVTGLFDDEESARLRQAGIPLADRALHARRERSLWRAVVAQAGRVTITYRTTAAGGAPLLPSLMVPPHEPDTELPRARVPGAEAVPLGPAEADRGAVARLAATLRESRETDALPAVAPAHPARVRRALLAAVAEAHRDPEGRVTSPQDPALRPNPWNGLVRAPEVAEAIERRFGAEHVWSASELETYGGCPFLFLLERVLRIRPRAEADEQTSPQLQGTVAHRLLQRFYEEHAGRPPASLDRAAGERLEQIAEEVFAAAEQEGAWLGHAALWRVTRRNLLAEVRDYLAWELPKLADKGELPWRNEYAFGYEGEPVLVEGKDLAGRPRVLRLRGRVDRIDRLPAGRKGSRPWHRVIDYKRSRCPSPRGYDDGSVLQAALYLYALERLGVDVAVAVYRSIRKKRNGAELKRTAERYEAALRFALSIPDRIRAGAFEPVKAAAAGGWEDWEPPVEIVRSRAVLPKGRHRFGDGGEGL